MSTRVARAALGVTAALLLHTPAAAAQAAPSAKADSLLAHLVGHWRMRGNVRGRPVTYELDARRVLHGRFIELHMIDTARPPQYESRVFVGADTTPGAVIVHWLDSFGAAYSVPAAAGSVHGDTLEFTFAYGGGPFRDTFVYDHPTDTWAMRLESSDGHGGWRRFATYVTRRAR